MATSVKLSLSGLEEYMEAIAAAGSDVDADVQDALMEGAKKIQDEMKNLVPVGKAPEDPHPGNLKRNIKIDGPHKDGNYNWVEVGVIHKKGFTDKETAIYGNVQEYGSASNQAQPFIRPGIDHGKSKASKKIKDILKERGKL
jgi:HK97 gp10 family phage protein